jgi:hypothetical protein
MTVAIEWANPRATTMTAWTRGAHFRYLMTRLLSGWAMWRVSDKERALLTGVNKALE